MNDFDIIIEIDGYTIMNDFDIIIEVDGYTIKTNTDMIEEDVIRQRMGFKPKNE